MNEIEIRRMQPSDVEVVAEVDSFAYLNNPGTHIMYGGNGEKERKLLEKAKIKFYTNNPQDTYVAINEEKIVGVLRSAPCTGDMFSSTPFSNEEYTYFSSKKIEQLSFEERVKWWRMTWQKHDPVIPHSHMGPIAVSPEFQGHGIGSKLMKDYLARLDRSGTPSHLETNLLVTVRYYMKFGYKLVETDNALGVDFYFMWRDAHSS